MTKTTKTAYVNHRTLANLAGERAVKTTPITEDERLANYVRQLGRGRAMTPRQGRRAGKKANRALLTQAKG